MATPKKVVRWPVQCAIVGAVRLDTSRWLLDLACGAVVEVKSGGRPKNARMRCVTCEAQKAKAP